MQAAQGGAAPQTLAQDHAAARVDRHLIEVQLVGPAGDCVDARVHADDQRAAALDRERQVADANPRVGLFDAMGQRFDPLAWFRLFAKYGITNFTAPPTVYRMLMTVGERAGEFDLSRLRHAVTAGEPLPSDTLEAIRRQLGVTPLDVATFAAVR